MRIRCDKCDKNLYEGEEIKPPQEIIQRYSNRCPECGKKLARFPLKVEIKPVTHVQ
jgi:phage FluMu protein Com